LKSDALYLWERFDQVLRIRLPEAQRVIYGQSLGTGIAVDLATRTEAAGLVLETPFTRLCEVIEHQIPYAPACRLMWDEVYPVIDQISDVKAPVLVLHGTDDKVIPINMAREVADRGAQIEMKVYQGGQHNNLRLFGAGADARAFIDRVTD